MATSSRFRTVVESAEELRVLYRAPSPLVLGKVQAVLDEATIAFVGRSPFVLVATGGEDGLDVSPRGGPAGFVKVLDPHHLAIPDMPGNNLLDTITNVVRSGRVGLLFLVPGKDETVRINGKAWLTTDDDVLDLCTDQTKRPKSVIGVEVEQVFVHCAKAFRRSALWDPETWTVLSDAPDASAMLVCQGVAGDMPVETLRTAFEAGYVRDLAEELPTG